MQNQQDARGGSRKGWILGAVGVVVLVAGVFLVIQVRRAQEARRQEALAAAATARRLPFILSTTTTADPETIGRITGGTHWFQFYVPVDAGLREALLSRVEASRCEVLVLLADVPGASPSALKLTVEQGILTITGERRFEKEEKDKKYHRVERSYGSFIRSFSVPDDSDADHVSAEFRDGVLRVHLPKSEKSRPRQVEVKVA